MFLFKFIKENFYELIQIAMFVSFCYGLEYVLINLFGFTEERITYGQCITLGILVIGFLCFLIYCSLDNKKQKHKKTNCPNMDKF